MFEIGLGCGVAEICGLVIFFSIPRAYHEHTFLNKKFFFFFGKSHDDDDIKETQQQQQQQQQQRKI